VAKNNTTFRLKDVKELTYAAFGKITKDVWTKAEEHVDKIEKEYCSRKENVVLCKIVLENSFFLTKIWAYRIFCFNIVITCII
jgi:t-SNARE complex subunit (syntaxin)